jgi:hypothetical protein
MLRIVIAVFVLSLATLVCALVFLPWWGFLLALAGVFAGLMLCARWLSGRVMNQLFTVPFRAKGAALKGARADVHDVVPAVVESKQPPEAPTEPVDTYAVDVTITPGATLGPFKFWEPGELLLVPASMRAPRGEFPDGLQVSDVSVFKGGQFGPDEETKYFGPQRLRLLVELPRAAERKQAFQYYFERFGAVTFPQAPSHATTDGRNDGDAERASTRS